MIGRADKNGPQGDGVTEDVSFTLNTIDRHGVCCKDEPLYCMATQQGGAEIADNLCPTITASAGMSGNNQPSSGSTVLHASGFCTEHSAKSRTIGYEDERSPTLRARRHSCGTA